MIPAEFRESGIKDYGPPHSHVDGADRGLGRRRVRARPDAADADLRRGRLRRHAVQGPAGRALRHPDQQDLAQQRPGADQHQQHAQRRGAADQGAGRPGARDRSAARARRRGGARRVRRAREVADDGRAGPAELQPLPRRVPRRTRRREQRRPHARRRSSWPTTTSNCEYVKLDQHGDRRAAQERAGDGLGQLRHPVSAGLPDHGARARSSPRTPSPSCASST